MSKRNDLSGKIFDLIRVFKILSNVFLFNKPIRLFCRIRGIKLGKGTVFNGKPNINRAPGSSIIIGENCKFNSAKNSATLFVNQRCAFVTVLKDAEIVIGNNSGGTATTIAAASSVRIGDDVMIGANTKIIDNDFHDPNPEKRDEIEFPARPVIIDNNVFIGLNCLILKGVRIGENSVIGANSVVLGSIPPNSLAMGNPCKVIMKRNWGKKEES